MDLQEDKKLYAKETKENVFGILEQKNGIELFFVLDKDEEKIIKSVNIADEQDKEDTSSEELLSGFECVVKKTFAEYEDSLEILKLSSADERKNGLYYYDLETLPDELEFMKKVWDDSDFDKFNFQEDSFDEISAFIIVIGTAENKMILYKQQYPISLLRRDKYMFTPVLHENRLKKVQQDILRVDFNFQFCYVNGVFYISDIDRMEKICSFHNVIVNEAKKSIKLILDADILDNVEVLEDELDNVTFARKLTRIYKDSKVLGKISKDVIVEFTKKHSYFKKNPLKSTDENKFILDTKKSKETFIKLMNDDFLKSELTNYEYESLAKNGMEKDNG